MTSAAATSYDSSYDALGELPVELEVQEIVSSRYPTNKRPASWDGRLRGLDIIRTADNRTVKLFSDAGQSPPQPGWSIVVTGGNPEQGYTWTLYRLSRGL